MTEKTLADIHAAYCLAVETSTETVTQVAENFLSILYDLEVVTEKDQQQLDNFILGVERCLNERKFTFPLTNICEEVLYTTMIIQGWMNKERGMHLDVNYSARRKSLESEFAKLLSKAKKNEYTSIADRFGIRSIVFNEDVNLIYSLSDTIIGILTGIDREQRKAFINWINATSSIDEFSKVRVLKTLEIPFEIEPRDRKDYEKFIPENFPNVKVPRRSGTKYNMYVKDYIHKPKSNGYQSLHFVLRIGPTSKVLPGYRIEYQMRGGEMHKHALFGEASYDEFKEERSEETDIFTLDNFDNLNVKGFWSYHSTETDVDGLHFSKTFYNRRINDLAL